MQPGRVDMTDQGFGSDAEIAEAEIGRLDDWVKFDKSAFANNSVDAAIASTTTAMVGNSGSYGRDAQVSYHLSCGGIWPSSKEARADGNGSV